MRRISFLLPLLLAGCVTGPSLESRMAAFTGASGETLVQDLGVPDKEISLNGVQYMAYVRSRTEIDPPPVYLGFGGFGGPFWGYDPAPFYGAVPLPSTVTVWRCETTFRLRDDKVVDFTLRGNDCS